MGAEPCDGGCVEVREDVAGGRIYATICVGTSSSSLLYGGSIERVGRRWTAGGRERRRVQETSCERAGRFQLALERDAAMVS